MTAATRNEKHIRSASQVLYLALELGVEESKLAFIPDLEAKPRVRTMPARDLKRLVTEVATAMRWFGLPDRTRVHSCYEAGRDGFWLHRYLATVGIKNRVVDSGSIEVNRRQRRAKSDGLDARKLVTMLVRYHAGESRVWSVVRIPTVEQEDRRQLHRELRMWKQDRVRVTNRIRGLLATQGVRLSKVRDVGALVDELRLWDGSPLPDGLRARLRREWEHAQFLYTKILELHRHRSRALKHDNSPAVGKIRQLLQLRGIGENAAWVYVHEFFGWRQFRNGKEVGAAAGLTPTHYQSGDVCREQGINKAGNRHIRAVAIELAWCWLRHQPGSRLSRWYNERFSRGGTRARKIGIVALARHLLIELWRFLKDGTMPEGALLKADAA